MPTEAKEIFEATSKSVKELLSETGLGLYIPPYQRPYGWDAGKVTKMLDDALHGFGMLSRTDESFTFLGTIIAIHDIKYTTVQPIVREEVPAKVLTVIDGQQRLSTLLMITICLHNQIRLRHWKVLKGRSPTSDEAELFWLHGQTLSMLKDLRTTFVETQAYGDSPLYPRMIRAFDDQWSRKTALAKYVSPLANLIHQYLPTIDESKPVEYKPSPRDGAIEGEAAITRRFSELRVSFRNIAEAKSSDELEDLPPLVVIAANKDLQRALLNHEFPPEVTAALMNPPSNEFGELARLLLVSAYLLNRVALTLVKGKNEDYAFSIFESLNTTGEPLTAFETFKPRVVSAEGLASYESSPARACMDRISDYLSVFTVGSQLQNATRDLLIYFATGETGYKLSTRLADQRTYLKEEFERHQADPAARLSFIQHLQDTATFMDSAWVPKDRTPSLRGLPVEATTDSVRLCVAFLRDLNHTVAIGALVRFYSTAMRADPSSQARHIDNFESALKALTAFSVLWRSFNRGTANIDREYREVMSGQHGQSADGGLTGLGPLARMRRRRQGSQGQDPIVDVAGLRSELRARLESPDHGGIKDRDQWVGQASALPMYNQSRPLTRFLLLAAYHDTVEDSVAQGLIKKGKVSSSPCLTFDGWSDDKHLSLEHIAPQATTSSWPEELYANKEVVHRLGNLVLVPADANSSLSDRSWDQKRVLYAALGASSRDASRSLLENAAAAGTTFAKSTEELVEIAKHMPHLGALGGRHEQWSATFIDQRSRRLLELAWDHLYSWLT
jgi:hypothetical protein